MDAAGARSTRAAASGARRRTRSSAPASSRTRASSSARARTSAPASRTPRCTRSTKPASAARGATLYCTLEPCAHTGRTGPVHRAHHRRRHPPRRGGDGGSVSAGAAAAASRALRAHGIDVEVGVERDAAVAPESAVPHGRARRAAVRHPQGGASLDGRIAAAPGERTPLTSAAARRHAHYDRAQGRRDRRRLGDGAGRRSAADGARGVPRAAADARRLRSPAAHAARGARSSRRSRRDR